MRAGGISPEHKAIISEANKGKHVSEETRSKLSIATKKHRASNPWTDERMVNIKLKTTLREGVSVSVLNTETKEVKEFNTQK